MEITLLNGQRSHRLDLPGIRRFLDRLVRAHPVGADGLAVRFVADRAMRAYNRTFRGKDATTDVLSFPNDGMGPDGVVHLGDIVISVPRAREQAAARAHSFRREIELLLIHGYLHLLGHDHETDRGEMKRLERKIASKLAPLRRAG